MKVTWEFSDIIAGRKFKKPKTSETWMIGYTIDVNAPKGAIQKYRMISLHDGLCCEEYAASDLAAQLTEQGYVPVELL